MKTTTCAHCGMVLEADAGAEFEGQIWCADCLEEETVVCRDCGTRIRNSDNAGSYEHVLCDACYHLDYTNCTRCGALLRSSMAYYLEDDEDEDWPYCDTCFHGMTKKVIHEYSYKPMPVYYGDGPRYFGVELEIDGSGESNAHAGTLQRITDSFYCKHDGSLDRGFEIVTHPMSLDYHLHEMEWPEILQTALDLGYLSHKTKTCGLHIHVSRDAFGDTEDEQDAVIARILYFVERHWSEVLHFTRRTQSSLDRWAARYGYKEHPHEILDQALRYVKIDLGPPEEIFLSCSDLVRIDRHGAITRSTFDAGHLQPGTRWYYPPYPLYNWKTCSQHKLPSDTGHIDTLKSVAGAFGYNAEDVDILLAQGLTFDEIEDYLYEGMYCR